MSGLHWRIVAVVGEVSEDGRMLDGLEFTAGHRYPVVGRDGPGVLLRLHGKFVQAKLPRFWSGHNSLAVDGRAEHREIDGRDVLVFTRPRARSLGPGRNAWDPNR